MEVWIKIKPVAGYRLMRNRVANKKLSTEICVCFIRGGERSGACAETYNWRGRGKFSEKSPAQKRSGTTVPEKFAGDAETAVAAKKKILLYQDRAADCPAKRLTCLRRLRSLLITRCVSFVSW